MPCFSLLKRLETQPWLGLCNLFISFQAGLCKLIHGGWAKEAGEANRRTENKQYWTAPCLWGGSCREMEVGEWGCRGLSGGEGVLTRGEWGPHCCISHILWKPCPTSTRSLGSCSPHLGKLLSLSIQLAPWEKRRWVGEDQSGSQQRENWQHGDTSLESPPASAPTRTSTDRAREVPLVPRRLPSQLSLLPQSSYRITRAQTFGSSGRFA